MTPTRLLIVLAMLAYCPSADAAGLARTDNFRVYVSDWKGDEADAKLVKAIADRAEKYRKEIAREWFGVELPDGITNTTIYLEFCDRESALHFAKGAGPIHSNTIFIASKKPDGEFASVLKHEICHSVCATFHPHPNRIPKDFEERIALTYNTRTTAEKRAELQRQLRAWEATR